MNYASPKIPESYKQLADCIVGIPLPDELSVVSLFSGCGGMDTGFLGGFSFLGTTYNRLPYRIVFANDNSEAACRAYAQNIGDHILCADVAEAMKDLPETCDVLIGGFPCQDVSVNGKRLAAKGNRTILYRHMIHAIRDLRPRAFVAENVSGMLACDFGEKVLKDFQLPEYTVTHQVSMATDWGVPQTRKRLLIVGSLGDREFEFPKPISSNPVTAKDAISDLETMEEVNELKHIWSKAKPSPDQGSRKLRMNAPATTMRAEHHGNVQWHYSLPRRISLREQARFQSFPDEFCFPCGMRETERQIGNAVPPVMAWHIANALKEQFFS